MAFLRSNFANDTGPSLYGNGLMLRMPGASDFSAWKALREQSQTHLIAWEPAWSWDELSQTAYRRRLRHYYREHREESGYAFFIFVGPNQQLAGGVTLSNVRKGVTQSCSLGYWTGLPYAGRGIMTEGVRLAADFVFNTLKLHRLEAACIPANTASIRVLNKNDFIREGLARKYLKINGVWQDHLLFARLAEDL